MFRLRLSASQPLWTLISAPAPKAMGTCFFVTSLASVLILLTHISSSMEALSQATDGFRNAVLVEAVLQSNAAIYRLSCVGTEETGGLVGVDNSQGRLTCLYDLPWQAERSNYFKLLYRWYFEEGAYPRSSLQNIRLPSPDIPISSA